MIHNDRHVDKLELGQKVKKWFANVEDGDFTSCTNGKPFFRYFNSHFLPPYEI
jgi:hypothetical protein